MNKIVTLRVGDKYGPEYPAKLLNGLQRYTTQSFVFECITKEEFPGWWNKLLLFPPAERIVFLDLDIVITGNIDFLFDYDGPFCAWKDPWAFGCNTSVMSIAAGYGVRIREAFLRNPDAIMRAFHGDQDVVNYIIGVDKIDWWDYRVASYKADKMQDGFRKTSIVVFHGDPKPHTFANGWVHDNWI